MTKRLPAPMLHAAVVCDQAIQEVGTGKWSLIGTFTVIWARQVPVVHPQLAIYLCISDAEGSYPLSVELVHLDTDQVIGRVSGFDLVARSRLDVTEGAITLRFLRFPEFGKYVFRLYLGDFLVGEKPFWVKQARDVAPGQLPPPREGSEAE